MSQLARFLKKKQVGLTSEHAVLLLFLGTATWMFIAAGEYSFLAALFPRTMASVVIILSLLLLFKNYLPGPLHSLVANEVDVFKTEQDAVTDQPKEDVSQPTDGAEEPPESKLGLKNSTVIFVLTCGYFVLAYMISILLASPIFTIVYAYIQSVSWYKIVILTIISLGIPWTFMELLNIPMDQGYLLTELSVEI